MISFNSKCNLSFTSTGVLSNYHYQVVCLPVVSHK